MKNLKILIVLLVPALIIWGWTTKIDDWIVEKHSGYKLMYTEKDEPNIEEYLLFINDGIKSVKDFFGDPFKNEFEIIIHPDRASLDYQWRKDWNMSDFKSECWMVGSGFANKLDLISPRY